MLEDVLWDFEIVQDWEQRIETYSDDKKQMYKFLISKAFELKSMLAHKTGWDVMVNDQKKDLVIECKKQQSGFMSVRSQGGLDFPALDVWRTINANAMRASWDVNQEKIFWDSKLGVNLYRLYTQTRKISVVSGRDFLLHALTYVDTDATIYCPAVSPEHDPEFQAKYPPKKGVVRGSVPLQGWAIRPDPVDPNKCRLFLYSEVDLNGSIPSFVQKLAFKDQGYLVDQLRSIVPKMREKYRDKFV